MQTEQRARTWGMVALLLVTVFFVGSCRSGADPAAEPVAATEDAGPPDSPDASSLPQNHEAYATAVQDLGQTTSTKAATLYFIKPGNGQIFRRGTSIKIEAQSSARQELRQVTFYVNGRRIGASSSNPYRVSWWAKDRGRFIITVEATQRGGKRTAASVSVTIE